MSYCSDCGCKIYDGICSNCHEELYIITNQGEYIDFELSEDFKERARESSAKLKEQGDK